MARYATPGVYIKEKTAFTSSVVAVPTAIPAFIGYTEKAERGNTSLRNVPTKVSSLAEYARLFGGAPKTKFSIATTETGGFNLTSEQEEFLLYNSLRLFFANGGGECYIISVGDYSSQVSVKDLNDPETGRGLATLLTEQEPTILVIPDAVLLDKDDCYSLYQAMLLHCGGDMESRVAILDVHGGNGERTLGDDDIITAFRQGVGNNFMAFGSGYYPWLQTTITTPDEVSFQNISNIESLIEVLTKEAETIYLGGPLVPPVEGESNPGDYIDPKRLQKFEAVRAEIEKVGATGNDNVKIDQTLKAISPLYKEILVEIQKKLNLLPPSGAIAGIYALTDRMVGVHKAPANVSLSSVISPSVNLTSANQEDLNLPLNGKAVNAIRSFIGKGVLVWGARTLAGNSQDWKYINVRRTMIMIEQSIKNSVEAYVFEPNTARTWIKVRTSIVNFLTDVWKQGALVGASTTEAFQVDVGLGTTMTPQDILEGLMKITIKVAISRPAEFIELTFQQKMQES